MSFDTLTCTQGIDASDFLIVDYKTSSYRSAEWESIEDWFSGPTREKAEQDFMVLVNEESSNSLRLTAFEQLKFRVGTSFKDRFIISLDKHSQASFVIMLNESRITLPITPLEFEQKIDSEFIKELSNKSIDCCRKAFYQDLGRSAYKFNSGGNIKRFQAEDKIDIGTKKNLAESMSTDDDQKKIMYLLGHQIMAGVILNIDEERRYLIDHETVVNKFYIEKYQDNDLMLKYELRRTYRELSEEYIKSRIECQHETVSWHLTFLISASKFSCISADVKTTPRTLPSGFVFV